MTSDSSYNNGNNDANKQWSVGGETVEGEVVERVNISEQTPITVPGCQHKNTKKRPAPEFPNCTEVTCEDCPIGWYIEN